jgi:hypothetical protein
MAKQVKKTKEKYPNIQAECDKILKLMKTNQDFLCKEPNHPLLAYIMLRWQNLFYAGRVIYGDSKYGYQCQNNPKYEFEDMENNDKNGNIIYDAWGVGVGMEQLIPPDFLKNHMIGDRVGQLNEADFDELATYFSKEDDFTKLQYKKNKTMDDWYALLGNPNYRYYSIYQDKQSIDDHLLCTNGNGYDWNKDGFICDRGSSDDGRGGFGKFPLLKGNITGEGKKIEDKLNTILFQPHVQKCMNDAKEQSNKQILEYKKTELLNSLSFSVGSAVMERVFGYETSSVETHQLITDFVEEAFLKYEGSKEIEKLAKRYRELWNEVKSKMPKKLSFDARSKWEKENTPAEMTEINKKIGDFYKPFKKIVEENFKKSKFTAQQLVEIDKFQKKAMDEFLDSPEAKKMFGKRNSGREKGHYYPMSKNYCAMSNMPKNAHPSYVKACIEVCLDIVQNAKVKKDSRKHDEDRTKSNILFAKEFLAEHGYDEYKKDIPKKIDKYGILKSVQDLYAPIFGMYPQTKIENYGEQKTGSTNLHLNDTAKNKYADDNIYCYLKISSNDFPKGISDSPEIIKDSSKLLYDYLKEFLKGVKKIEDVHSVLFYCENLDRDASIQIQIYTNRDYAQYQKDITKSEKEFVKQGFSLSNNRMSLELDEYILVTQKSKTLGSRHDMNTDGKQYFSNAQYFAVYDKDWNKIDESYQIDERGFNIFSGGKKSELTKWLTEQHAAMKSNDKGYGSYNSQERNNSKEGKKHLYAHDFMLWLKEHQMVKTAN